MGLTRLNMNHSDLPAGSVLQVVTTSTKSHYDFSGTSTDEITDLSTTITPKKTGSKILVMFTLDVGSDTSTAAWYAWELCRDSSSNLVQRVGTYFGGLYGAPIGNTINAQALDDVTTTAGTARTYKVFHAGTSSAGAVDINWDTSRSTSSMTLMEIAQ